MRLDLFKKKAGFLLFRRTPLRIFVGMNTPTLVPSILIIYTGGTIGMMENPETGALENFDWEQLRHYVPELKRFGYRIDTQSFDPPIDSSNMTPCDWQKSYISLKNITTIMTVLSCSTARIPWPTRHRP